GDPRRLTMYLATLDCATSNPSLSSSPRMRGAPHSGFSMLICWISARSSVSICGRPPNERDFQRQYRRKPARCQRTSVSGRMTVITFSTDGNHRYSWIKNKRSPLVRRMRPHLAPQNNQLISERGVLYLKPTAAYIEIVVEVPWGSRFMLFRETKTLRTKHSSAIIVALTSGDSLPQSIRIGFSVHTAN